MGNIIAIREIDRLPGEAFESTARLINQTIALLYSTLKLPHFKSSDNVAILTGTNPDVMTSIIADRVSVVFNKEPWSKNIFIDDNVDPAQLKEFLRRMFAHSTTTFIVIAGLDYITKLASSASIASEIPPIYTKGELERLIPQGSVHYLEYKGKKK